MKTEKKKLRLPITLKLYEKGKMIDSSVCLKKTQILIRARGKKWEKAYLKVTYGPDNFNDSDHYSYDSLKRALDAYTEDSLLKFIFEEQES